MKINVLMSSRMLGTDLFHILASFVIYSILGWFVESVYMSFCNKKITNRGFAKGPFCPIYGFGATFGSLLLAPFANSFFTIYVIGAVVATVFEYLVGLLMIKVLGALWWDYNDKPYNYKGIICLESTIGWGFYAIGVVEYLNKFIVRVIDSINRSYMIYFIEIVLCIAVVDYIISLYHVFPAPVNNMKSKVKTVYKNIHDRWF